MQEQRGYVYIATNSSGALYIGVTTDLGRRMWEHKQRVGNTCATRYGITRLVYYEDAASIREAIARGRQIADWRREKKMSLIEQMNPEWKDLSEGWYDYPPHPASLPQQQPFDAPALSGVEGACPERSRRSLP